MKKTFNFLMMLAFVGLGLVSCNDDDNNVQLLDVESKTIENLYAPQEADYTVNPPIVKGDFTKFSFSTGKMTTSDTDWDIAFRGTTIIANGGKSTGAIDEPERTGNAAIYIEDGTLASVTAVKDSLFKQDSEDGLAIPTGSGNGWYIYDHTSHTIQPVAGKVIVVKTVTGKYAKMEILSYYKNKDTSNRENSRYYTFNYVYQPNEGVTTFE